MQPSLHYKKNILDIIWVKLKRLYMVEELEPLISHYRLLIIFLNNKD